MLWWKIIDKLLQIHFRIFPQICSQKSAYRLRQQHTCKKCQQRRESVTNCTGFRTHIPKMVGIFLKEVNVLVQTKKTLPSVIALIAKHIHRGIHRRLIKLEGWINECHDEWLKITCYRFISEDFHRPVHKRLQSVETVAAHLWHVPTKVREYLKLYRFLYLPFHSICNIQFIFRNRKKFYH